MIENRAYESSHNVLFISGVHMDLQCRLDKMAKNGVSNPGKAKFIPGGAGLNTASIYSKLGGECVLTGFVGNDEHGGNLHKTLKLRGIENQLQTVDNRSTGLYVAVIEPDGSVHIAFADLSLADELTGTWLFENKADILHQTDTWFLNANLNHECLKDIVAARDSFGNKAIAAASISPQKAPRLASILSEIDILFTNLQEARSILENESLSAESCVSAFIERGVSIGSLSNGSNALWIWENDQVKKYVPDSIEAPVDETGAGDALAAALLFGFMNKISLTECASFAISCARAVVEIDGPYDQNLNLPNLV